ncbi:MAG TPA: peptidyl-prolyl cis-trans isomerase [Bryobacteraceae bacterium]|jgi:peptidyl-prolyl cis-trans isomerase D|nr:peptidyl-prolyl cis-trans isomerase [Bryobacteraceae bacterium]
MFDLFRSREKSVRILLGALLVVVALSMCLYLIPGGPGSASGPTGNTIVATVGDQKITLQQLQQSIDSINQRQNIPKQLMAQYVPVILNSMVEVEALAYRARQLGITVSDAELADLIRADMSRALGGTNFDLSLYQAALAQQGMTVADFEHKQRQDFLASRLESLQLQSVVVSEAEAKQRYREDNEKVALQYIAFDPKHFVAKVNQDPAALKAYFDKNRSLFQTPEKRSADLIVGTVPDFEKTAKVTDAQLQQLYNTNLDSYRLPERVHVRHILIMTQGKSPEEKAKLKAKAEDVLSQLKKGADFATLAKKDSEDPGSAAKGGDLGWIARGQTVPQFEQAAFSQKPGDLSGVVESSFGYHIIQVLEHQAAHLQTFDEVKPQLMAQMQKQVGTEDLKRAIADAHSEIEKNPGQADEIAKKYSLRVFKVDQLASNQPLPEVMSAPEPMTAIFSTPKGQVTKVVNLDSMGKSVFAVVDSITPAHPSSFEDAHKEVVDRYTTAESLRMNREAAAQADAEAKKGESLEAIAKKNGFDVKTASPFTITGAAEGIGPATVLRAAFSANVGDVIPVVSMESNAFVCKVTQKVPANMADYEKNKTAYIQQLNEQLQGFYQKLFRESVVADMTKNGKVKLNQELISRVVADTQS